MTQAHRRPFESVAENLMKLGTLALDHFLYSPSLDPPLPDPSIFTNIPTREPLASSSATVQEDNPATVTPLMLLHQVCSQTFGNLDPLKYEILAEGPQTKKACILTISRPNGSSRSYTCNAEFSRKAEAKAAVASAAIDLGALDFIREGAPDHASIKRGLVLAPLDAPSTLDHEASLEGEVRQDAETHVAVKQIEDCAKEWRAGRVKPYWVELSEQKLVGKRGCALRIQLSPHSVKVVSTTIQYGEYADAKIACALEAIKQGVLEFIMHGNGQTRPADANPLLEPDEEQNAPASLSAAVSLQGFFDSLPRPFPEPIEGKTVQDINAPAWLHGLVQAARGARLRLNFIWTIEPKYGLHGAVLRVESPHDCKTFMVDPGFPKRVDAKTAVCLLAMSQGVGKHIRQLGEDVGNKITPEMRQDAQSIIPLIAAEYMKIWPEKCPDPYSYSREQDAIGSTLTLRLSEDEHRSWTVQPEYRKNNDAKIAVAILAFQEGAIEYLRFRGQSPPPGYVVQLPSRVGNADGSTNEVTGKKRKAPGDFNDPAQTKRHKGDSRGHSSRSPTNSRDFKKSKYDRRVGGKGAWSRSNHAGPPSGSRASGPWNRDTRRPDWGPAHGGPGFGRYEPRPGPSGGFNGDTIPYVPKPYGGLPPPPPPALPAHLPHPPHLAVHTSKGDTRASPPKADPPRNERTERVWQPGPHASSPPRPPQPSKGQRGPEFKQVPAPAQIMNQTVSAREQKRDRSQPYNEKQQQRTSSSRLPDGPRPSAVSTKPVVAPSAPSTRSIPASKPLTHVVPASKAMTPVVPTIKAVHPAAPAVVKQPVAPQHVVKAAVPPTTHPVSQAAERKNSAPVVASTSTPSVSGAARPRQRTIDTTKDSVRPGTSSSADKPTTTKPSAPQAVSTSAPPATVSPTKVKSTPVPSQAKTSSFRSALLEYCSKNSQAQPQFFSAEDTGKADGGSKQYKLWAVVGKEKMELPKTFPNVAEGHERLAKQILKRMHAQSQKPKT